MRRCGDCGAPRGYAKRHYVQACDPLTCDSPLHSYVGLAAAPVRPCILVLLGSHLCLFECSVSLNLSSYGENAFYRCRDNGKYQRINVSKTSLALDRCSQIVSLFIIRGMLIILLHRGSVGTDAIAYIL